MIMSKEMRPNRMCPSKSEGGRNTFVFLGVFKAVVAKEDEDAHEESKP